MTLDGRAREALGALLAVVVAFVAAAVLTWPMVTLMDEVVLGGGELGGWLWRYDWHFREVEAIQEAATGPVQLWREFVSLGRYPETGNILDVLAFNLPLERLAGFPESYNLKILVVLVGNGLAAYALGRYVSGSIAAALAASVVAVVNPLTILEIQASGLRQALLWWVLLYPALLDRALRRRTVGAGLVAGACFGAAGAFYWFYGLFTGIFTVFWLVAHLTVERRRIDVRGLLRAGVGLGVGLALAAGPFILPYVFAEGGASAGTRESLPEMTFFLPYPAFDTVIHAPMRPQTYAENILASINRTVGSSWSASYAFDPSLNESLPIVVFFLGVLPAVVRKRAWGWLVAWIFFYVGTMGPFLRWGEGDSRNVVRVGEYVIRLPYTVLFQYVPGMSRMFAPYRLGSFVVVTSVALLAMGLARWRLRAWLAPLVMVAVVAQPMYRWGRGAVSEGGADSREWRSPIKVNRIRVPEVYREIAKEPELTGIVELPLDQQQDLVCYYQVIHGKKVYRSWASPGAIPPSLRRKGTGGAIGDQLRFQARADERGGPIYDAWVALSRDPESADLAALTPEALQKWAKNGQYRRVIVHERGYYLVDPRRGSALYRAAVNRIAEALGVPANEIVEVERGDDANPVPGIPTSGDLLTWTSQPVDLPASSAPAKIHMAVIDLPVASTTDATRATTPAAAPETALPTTSGADPAPAASPAPTSSPAAAPPKVPTPVIAPKAP